MTAPKALFTMKASRSKAVAEHGYDAATQTMRVTFRGGRSYEYSGVPPNVYGEFANNESHGVSFARLIAGKYRGRKLDNKE